MLKSSTGTIVTEEICKGKYFYNRKKQVAFYLIGNSLVEFYFKGKKYNLHETGTSGTSSIKASSLSDSNTIVNNNNMTISRYTPKIFQLGDTEFSIQLGELNLGRVKTGVNGEESMEEKTIFLMNGEAVLLIGTRFPSLYKEACTII